MQVITTTKGLEEQIFQYKKKSYTIAFVPTMGYLHQGHISLVRLAKQHADKVVVSIFINPTQFTDPQDLNKYPQNHKQDITLLQSEGVDTIFIPDARQIYPNKKSQNYSIILPEKFLVEEGATRPGHFEGVYQVLQILFHLVIPDYVIFGQKDYQQILLVQYLLQKEFFEINLVVGDIFRESSGLAMSSRNKNLSIQGKKNAQILFQIIQTIQEKFSTGIINASELLRTAEQIISKNTTIEKISSLCFRDGKNFRQISTVHKGDIFLIALTIEGVHLLDNTIIS